MKKLFLLAIVVLGFTAVSFGQATTVLSADATAIVKKAITIVQEAPLDFGTFVVGSTAGTTTVTAAGVTTVTGGTKVLDGSQAVFSLSGPALTEIFITKPTTVVTLTNTLIPAATMTINVGGFLTDASVTTIADGSATFSVGAVLNYSANKQPGTYNGVYDITVNYN